MAGAAAVDCFGRLGDLVGDENAAGDTGVGDAAVGMAPGVGDDTVDVVTAALAG